jgi:hypothetical protein
MPLVTPAKEHLHKICIRARHTPKEIQTNDLSLLTVEEIIVIDNRN